MYLKNLSLVNFKNYEHLNVNFSSRINCFTGDNGAGKTNILDAIYYLSFCKSFFTSSDSANIRHNDSMFVINGEYSFEDRIEDIYCGVERGKKKKFKRNKKEYEKLADHIGLIPLVMITPNDINLIIGGSDERRKFIDGIISQFDRGYLHNLQNYNKALAQRNFFLKQQRGGEDLLEIYDSQLEEYGNYIFTKRKSFVKEIIPVFEKVFSHISQGKEKVKLDYLSQLHDNDFANLLKKSRGKDFKTGYSNVGIHKDDLTLLIDGYPAKKIGSQGQQKTYLVSLKLAQFEYIRDVCGFKPILLLDDVFDKLDHKRVEQIIKLVADNNFGQIFITDTNQERVKHVLEEINGEYFHYSVTDATLSEVNK